MTEDDQRRREEERRNREQSDIVGEFDDDADDFNDEFIEEDFREWQTEESDDDLNIPPEEPPLEAFFEKEVIDDKTKKKKKTLKRWQKFGIIFVSFLLVVQGAAALFQFLRPDVIDFLTTSYELSQNEEVAEWRESVVTLQVEAPGASSRGTGFFINEDGLIATNRHVVEEAFQVVATLHDGTAFQAEPVFISDELDFAIIDIGEQTPVPYLPLAEDEPIMDVGTDIIVIGNPLSFTGIANDGEVLATGTPAVISAPTFSGNSGSPAINHEGEVVGIIYATRNQGDEGRVGLMVPVNEVIDQVTMIEEGGTNE